MNQRTRDFKVGMKVKETRGRWPIGIIAEIQPKPHLLICIRTIQGKVWYFPSELEILEEKDDGDHET